MDLRRRHIDLRQDPVGRPLPLLQLLPLSSLFSRTARLSLALRLSLSLSLIFSIAGEIGTVACQSLMTRRMQMRKIQLICFPIPHGRRLINLLRAENPAKVAVWGRAGRCSKRAQVPPLADWPILPGRCCGRLHWLDWPACFWLRLLLTSSLCIALAWAEPFGEFRRVCARPGVFWRGRRSVFKIGLGAATNAKQADAA